MKIRITDITPEGKAVEFDLDPQAINARLKGSAIETPEYQFVPPLKANLRLELEVGGVMLKGKSSAHFKTVCARCAEEAEQELNVPVQMVLKPKTGREQEDVDMEDVQFGTYDGKEVDCSAVVEEALILALPYSVLCRADCKGLCPQCGANLNQGACKCAPGVKDERFKALEQLKVH